jgi:hypothetical protein
MKALVPFLLLLCILCLAQLPAAAQTNKPVSMVEKYSVKSFDKLKWQILPAELAEAQKLENGEWSLCNLSGGQLLLLADYQEQDIAVNCDIVFSNIVHTGDSVSFIFNYQYHEELGLAFYTQLRLTPDGKYFFGHSDGSHMVLQQEGRFPLAHDNPRRISLYAAKLRNDLFLAVNKRRFTIRTGIDNEPGGFGFLLQPGTKARLRNFRFVVYDEVNYPFEGVDVIKLFAPKTSPG